MKKKTIALLIGGLMSTQLYANSLENLQLRFLNNNDSVLKLDFDEKVPNIETFEINNGNIYLKFPKIKSGLSNDYFDVQDGNIKNIKVDERGNQLHMYISTDLEEKPVLLKAEDSITLTFKNNNVLSYEELDNLTEEKPDVFIDDVVFERENDNQAKIVISHNSKKPIYEILEHENGITLIMEEASIPSRLFKNSDTTAFKTPIKEYLTKLEDNSFVLDIVFDDKYKADFVSTSGDNEISIIIKGKKRVIISGDSNSKTNNSINETSFNGELISFNFQNIDVGSALYVIAEKMNLNLVMGDNISGNLSLKLKDVPYDQALDVILRTKGLGKYIEGNIMIVAPLEEIVKRESFELESSNKIKEIKPLNNKEVQINYAKATDVFKILDEMKSKRGKIIVDERTNKVFIEDIDEKVKSMERFIESIDIPVRQVSVEARIVYAKESAAEELGVRWSGGSTLDTSGYEQLGDTSLGLGDAALGSLGGAFNTAAITLGFMNANIDATLNALEESGDIEIVARPLIIASNKQESKIETGQEYPYLEYNDGDVTVNFKEILLSLNVTPQITPDDNLILDLAIVQDSINEITESGPALDTTEIETKVIVENMETLVLGGVFREESVEEEEKVPLLGDLPLLGNAFKYKEKTKEKVELLIFITPKILNGDEIINR